MQLQSGVSRRLPHRATLPRCAAVAGRRRNFTRSSRAIDGGHGVDQRMIVEGCVPHHGAVEHDRDAPVGVVDGAERRDRAGLDAERSAQQSGVPKEKRPPAPSRRCSDLRSIAASSSADDQEQRALLVLQEQVLGVPAGDLSAQRLRLLDREQRRMGHGAMGDAQPVEKAQENNAEGCCNHGALAGPCRYAEAPQLPRISPQMLQLQSGAAFGITGSRMRV